MLESSAPPLLSQDALLRESGSAKRLARQAPFNVVNGRLTRLARDLQVPLGTGYLAVTARDHETLFVIEAKSDSTIAVAWAKNRGELNVRFDFPPSFP